jgi:hypothetical protein
MWKYRHALLRTAVAASAAGALIAGSASGAAAFAPTRLKSLGANSHQSITEDSIRALDNEFFSIPRLTRPMEQAMGRIVAANEAVDDDQVQSALHFDGENFAGGQSRVTGLFNSVITDLAAENAGQARTDLGGALHTIQDFYAHSNWIESGHAGANPDLGRPGHTLGNLAARSEATCAADGGTLITTKLTSGYYGGEDSAAPPGVAKCRHGGILDSSPGGGSGINKDLTLTTFSPHAAMHAAAAAAARAATDQFIRDIKDKVTPRQLRLLFGIGPTLGMSIDTTGSMGGVIASVREQAIGITNARIGTDEEPSKYVLAPFNDPSVGPLTTTDDPDTFKSAISGLGADGGDDCPELSMTGMLQAIGAMDEGSDLFTFTDASAKDAGLADSVSSLAESKDIRIYPILFGNCGDGFAGSSTRTGQQPAPHAATPHAATPAAFVPNRAYEQVASATGGQVFALSTADAGTITQLADALVRSNAVGVLDQTVTLTDAGQDIAAPVDSSLTTVTFSASGAGASAQAVTVTRPDGTAVQPGDAGVRFVTLSAASSPVTIITVTAPAAGHWTVNLKGAGQTSLRVTGESALSLSSFRFLAGDGVAPQPSAHGVRAIDGFPVAGQVAGADATLSDGFPAGAHFDLRAADGSLVQALSLPQVVGNEYAAPITVPNAAFRVYVTDGGNVQRALSGLIKPQSVVVGAPAPAALSPGHASTFTFSVHNLAAAADTFAITASDDHGYLRSVTPDTLTLGPDATGTVAVTVQPPASAPGGTTDTLTVTATSTSVPALHNFAVLANGVTATPVDTTPPTIAATATPAANAAGWNNTNVTVALTATDDTSVASITYSTGGAPTTVPGATATVPVTTDGLTTVTYSATDSAGNTSAPRTLTVRLDKTAPTLTCRATPSLLFPPILLLIPVKVSVQAADATSGTAGFTLLSVQTSSGNHPLDVVGWTTGTADTQGFLRAITDGLRDRVYTLTYRAADVAGNTATCAATVRVTLFPPFAHGPTL